MGKMLGWSVLFLANLILLGSIFCSISAYNASLGPGLKQRRVLLNSEGACDEEKAEYKAYFDDVEKIYGFSSGVKRGYETTCLPVHKKCGWPKVCIDIDRAGKFWKVPDLGEVEKFSSC